MVNNNHFPHLPKEEINKLVEEMTDPNLLPSSQKTEDVEEEGIVMPKKSVFISWKQAIKRWILPLYSSGSQTGNSTNPSS